MLGIMLQKMWQKKWMNLCLLLGCILLIATVVSFPLYEKAAYDRMLTDEFKSYIANEGEYPSKIHMAVVSQKDKTGKNISRIEKKMNGIFEEFSVTKKQLTKYYFTLRGHMSSDMNREDAESIGASIGSLTDFENHIEIISGEKLSDTGLSENGEIEVLITQGCMVQQGLLVGETLTFDQLKFADGKPVKILVKGVFVPDETDPYYWQIQPRDMMDVCFTKESLFMDTFTGKNTGRYNLHCNIYALFEYEDITNEEVSSLIEKTKYLEKKSKYKSVTEKTLYLEILENYLKKVNRISATLTILQIPVLIMLAAFLLMISSQMYEMEKNEISVIKSRGSSRGQIFRIYLYQGILLTLVGGALAIPLGAYFAKVLGASKSFLDFDMGRVLTITYTERSMYYAIGAMIVTLLSITLPAISHSKVSIVNLKQSKNVLKKSLWKKLYLDVILLLVSLYGYYNFHRNMSGVSGTVLSGESLDPLLYLSSSLFIIGMGLFYLRIQPIIVKLIFKFTKKILKPASYISFMEAIKQSGKQQLIMLFLIMTVSLGMYHSTVARTILDNATSNTVYGDGCDMRFKERWTQVVDESGIPTGNFIEPDFQKYARMDFAKKYTKVFYDENGYISEGKNNNQIITIMGIHTKEFGEMTSVDRSVLSKPYYEYLNELADKSDGVIVSKNFKDKLGYDIGDTIYFHNSNKQNADMKIIDFFDYFPAYNPIRLDLNPDGTSVTEDNYLIVGHFDMLMQQFGRKPYELWIELKDDANPDDIYNWIQTEKIRVEKYVNRNEDLKMTVGDPLLQGTNGVLTLGFVVTLILCAAGYLIYWILSIKDRELIFGVLRASGFHKLEIVHMLLNEQIFSGILSVFAGIGIGYISSKLFVPIIQLSYASSSQILPLKLMMSMEDQLRLFITIGIVMLVCLFALITLLFRMNVTKALKLGEE